MSTLKGLYILILFNASVYQVDPVLIPVSWTFIQLVKAGFQINFK